MNDVWGNDEDYARKAAAKHRRARRKRAKARHAAGGCLLSLVPLALVSNEPTWKKIGCGTSLLVWAAVLVPLILWA